MIIRLVGGVSQKSIMLIRRGEGRDEKNLSIYIYDRFKMFINQTFISVQHIQAEMLMNTDEHPADEQFMHLAEGCINVFWISCCVKFGHQVPKPN